QIKYSPPQLIGQSVKPANQNARTLQIADGVPDTGQPMSDQGERRHEQQQHSGSRIPNTGRVCEQLELVECTAMRPGCETTSSFFVHVGGAKVDQDVHDEHDVNKDVNDGHGVCVVHWVLEFKGVFVLPLSPLENTMVSSSGSSSVARGDALRPVRPLADAPSSLFDGCFISTQVRRPQPLPGGISSGVIVSSGFQVLHSAELQAVQAVVESDRGTRGELDGRLRAAAAPSELPNQSAALTELEIRKPQKSRCLTLTTLFQQHRLIVLPSCHLTTSDVCLGCFQSLHLPSRRFLNAPVETLANKTAPPTKSMKLFANGQDGSVISPGSKMPKCPKCNKEVYFAEKVTSLGKDWHRPCLRCEKCNKTLSAGSHSEHDGKPYCNRPCYAALFGPGARTFLADKRQAPATDAVVREVLAGLLLAEVLQRVRPEQVAHRPEGGRLLEAKQVASGAGRAANLEQLHQVEELAVNVAADSHRGFHLQHSLLLAKQGGSIV
uniref:LIM zinc-binding domain-containing protein n=1 Tax=Macrostomum lignano TaxID=282301 RepID=A0A1I8IPM3_9PLAT